MKLLNTFATPEHNALLTALYNAAGAETVDDAGTAKIYDYLAEVPKSSLVVELIQELKLLGFSVVKTPGSA